MEGRIFGIKKSTLLTAFLVLVFMSFVTYMLLSIFLIKNPQLWFFGFCLFVGGYELFKSMLFKYDSCLYLGTLLLGIGIFGYVFFYTGTQNYAGFFVALAFAFASIATFLFTGQKFHLVIAYSIFFVELYALLLIKNLITAPIFVAFLVPFLLLLLLEIILICFHKK